MKKEKMVNLTLDGKFTVELPESKIAELFGKNYGKVELSTLKAGETFSTGEHEWVVLEQSGDTTAVLHKDVLEDYRRFDAKSNDWVRSEIRKWLNTEFAKEIADEIGGDNLVAHTPDLSTDNGSSEYTTDGKKDKVSMLSCNAYRRYYDVIPKTGSWYWTVTSMSSDCWLDYVRCVSSSGALVCNDCCSNRGGVRPFCIFKSKILILKGE